MRFLSEMVGQAGSFMSALNAPKPQPGSLSINTNNQGFPNPPRPGGTIYG